MYGLIFPEQKDKVNYNIMCVLYKEAEDVCMYLFTYVCFSHRIMCEQTITIFYLGGNNIWTVINFCLYNNNSENVYLKREKGKYIVVHCIDMN